MREVLANDHLGPEAAAAISSYHAGVVKEVKDAVTSNKIVVVGMSQNPFVKKARKALGEANMTFKYLEYGGYLSMWKPRLAIKLWSGWPTYPQVFVNGKLIGGYKELSQALSKKSI